MSQTLPPALHGPIQSTIQAFLQERLQTKLDELKEGEDEKRQKHLDAYHPQTWIADAARRVGQIQQVSHALKYTHPDARGSNLYSAGNPQAGECAIGTHTLGDGKKPDVVGNAAALDVYKFLRLEVEGQTLLQRAIAKDPALAAAFSDDAETSMAWMDAFATLVEPKGQPASHTLAKQVYWPLESGGYHLLAPLFPSSLAGAVWHSIRESRFSDSAKAARDARREGKPHREGYRDYPNFALQKFGGTKPQNISQLNSERYGENYLLASLPPSWQSAAIRAPLCVKSVFSGKFGGIFGSRSNVRSLTDKLKKFLLAVQKRNSTIDIRDERDEWLGQLCDELLNYAATLHELAPGWTKDPDCQLNPAEQCWLDPGRAEADPEFAAQYRRGDWQDEVARSFGIWLNSRLDTKKMHFDQSAAAHWAKAIERELGMFRLEIGHD